MRLIKFKKCPICNFNKFNLKFTYTKKPPIETDFKIKNYYREYYECKDCSHWVSNFRISEKFYKKFYTKQTYGKNYIDRFNKIISLKNKSDNYKRSNRIEKFIKRNIIQNVSILDVGSGLGVFPYEMSKKNYSIDALDPDQSMCKFMKKNLKINVHNMHFNNFKLKKKFNLITFNKVLEHVTKPLSFLNRARKHLLKENGIVYIEVPDTYQAKKISKLREEFCIEHINCFTRKSLLKMLDIANYKVLELTRIKEPSGKLTMYAFAKIK